MMLFEMMILPMRDKTTILGTRQPGLADRIPEPSIFKTSMHASSRSFPELANYEMQGSLKIGTLEMLADWKGMIGEFCRDCSELLRLERKSRELQLRKRMLSSSMRPC